MAKENPLEIKVQCKHCGFTQPYKGQIPCDRCGKSGSLQLVKETNGRNVDGSCRSQQNHAARVGANRNA